MGARRATASRAAQRAAARAEDEPSIPTRIGRTEPFVVVAFMTYLSIAGTVGPVRSDFAPFVFPAGAVGGHRGPAHQRPKAEQQTDPARERHATSDEPDQQRLLLRHRSGHLRAGGVGPD